MMNSTKESVEIVSDTISEPIFSVEKNERLYPGKHTPLAKIKQKEQSIETLRGIAIILMVAGHVIGPSSSLGLEVGDHSIFRYFFYSFQYLRMPLFTVISGYVYSLRPYSRETKIKQFLIGKARRILIPMLTLATLQYFLKAFIPGTHHTVHLSNIWRIYFFRFDQFWFLQAIFLVFVTIAIIEYFNLCKSFQNWTVIFAIVSGIRIFLPSFTFNIFSLDGYIELLPFFILGCGINRFRDQLFNRSMLNVYILVFIFSFTFQQFQWFYPQKVFITGIKILSFLVGFTGITLLFHIRKSVTLLAKLGFFSFSIYLFHILGTAGSRILLKYFIPDQNITVVFFVSLIFGLVIPIFLELILIKNKFTRQAFIGLK